jgi:hypothetical protein
MRLRLLALLGAVLATMTVVAAPVASASTSSQQLSVVASHGSAHLSESLPDQATNFPAFCQNSNIEECLNLTNCNTSKGIQLWNVLTGGACSSSWLIASDGTVNPGASPVYPFYCGDGLNSAYEGDQVYQILYDSGGVSLWAPTSAGNNNTVTLEPWDGTNYEGLFVAQDNESGPTRLIDVTATCGIGAVQHLYAGCGGSGCLVRDGQNPSSGDVWDLESWSQS